MNKSINEYLSLMDSFEEFTFEPVKDKESLFNDMYQTKQQFIRDKKITVLLNEYVRRFQNKNIELKKDRTVLKWFSMISLSLIVVVIIVIILFTVFSGRESTWVTLTGLISSLIALCTSLFGIINYIAARAFPIDDEKYITEIVKLIQENDLKHKQENIKASKATVENISEKD